MSVDGGGTPVLRRVLQALRDSAAALAFAVCLVLLWHAVVAARLVSPVFLPAPARVFDELCVQIRDASLLEPLAATTWRMALGWALASAVGIALGGLVGASRSARTYLSPMLEFMRPLPASAIIPVAVLFLGLSDRMSIAVIAFGSIWPVLLATVQGFASTEAQLIELASALCMRPAAVLRKIVLPGAVPDIMAGMRVSLAIALILAVVTEMQASQIGLGQNILLAQRSYRSAELYAGILVLGVLGFVLNQGLALVEARLLRWRAAPG